MNSRLQFKDNNFMITDHPYYKPFTNISLYDREKLKSILDHYYPELTKLTVTEASDVLTRILGKGYNFYSNECKRQSFQDIRELLMIRGYSHDLWREDCPERIPNNYLILDETALDGYYITFTGLEYIFQHKFLFELTEEELKCMSN